MKIFIKAKPNAKVEDVQELSPVPGVTGRNKSNLPTYKVSVRATPADGKANDAIVRALAKHLNIRTNDVRIVSGHTTSTKIIEINV